MPLRMDLRAHNGQYVCAEQGGGTHLVANRANPTEWETFGLYDPPHGTPIRSGDKVSIQAHNGMYVTARDGGGGAVNANASEQDIQIEVSTAQAPMHQVNAIELTIKRNNNSNTTTGSTSTATDNNFSLMMDKEIDITTRVRNAGDVLYDSVVLSIDKVKRKSVEKAKEVATRDANPAAIAAKKDAQDIAALGESIEGITRTFETLMTEIRKKPYSEQVRLLTGYKNLLKEQISVIDSHQYG